VPITEQVPAGFVLTSVSGGTLTGNTATATIRVGQTTTVTFTNDPTAVLVIPNSPALPPPPPFLFLPPPPPPLLPPPPAAPIGAAQAAFPEVPVVPEADGLGLLVAGLLGLGAVAGWRRRRPPGSE
jgi:MYXO-CTERM domain-containing protein